jgi:hypothetical protein
MVTITLTKEQIAEVVASVEVVADVDRPVDAAIVAVEPTFPRFVEAYQHTFASQDELDTYEKALAVRDANLANPENTDEKYSGRENPDLMTLYDIAFYLQNPGLKEKEQAIFDRRVVYRDIADGRLLHAGDLAALQTTNVRDYAANGGFLAKYL